jgi:hypothetical protein
MMTSQAASNAGVESPPSRPYGWHHKLAAVLLAIFCFEMGLFLMIFPWVDAWNVNYFGYFAPASYREASLAELWRGIWLSPYFRGAVSGLGVVNVYISLVQVFQLRRFSHPSGRAGGEPPVVAGEVR